MCHNLIYGIFFLIWISGSQYACDLNDSLVVAQIDHIPIGTNTTSESDLASLFTYLTETLLLPIAWPFKYYKGVLKGGVSLGNVNIELMMPPNGSPFQGVALAPCTRSESEITKVLTLKNLNFTVGENRDSEVYQKYNDWDFSDFAGLDSIFMCQYLFDEDARRQRLWEELLDVGGGPLGILKVKSVWLPDRGDLKIWKKLLDSWKVECDDGICITKLNAGPILGFHDPCCAPFQDSMGIWLETLNMTEAGRFAKAENILGTNSMLSDCVTLDFYPRFKIHHIPIMIC